MHTVTKKVVGVCAVFVRRFNHRTIDGATGAQFLQTFKTLKISDHACITD
jgi:pyruvate/2-oxoglutarate dehydrogenase complex dihydrolipoamide acyltransferase (E2) component